jgi:methionine-rich copper-binding protein CopC
MRRTLAVLLLTGVAVLAAAPAAEAHNYLVSSTPAAGQTLTELPAQFVITTNDKLLALDGQTGGFALQVVDAAGLHYESGCVEVSGASMTMADPQLGPAGAYTVRWQVVSSDGHTVSDEIPFTWKPPAGADLATGSASAPRCGQTAPTAGPTAAPSVSPDAGDAPPTGEAPAAIRLSDVLWIGGALVAVGVAVGVAILVLGRRGRR